MDMGTPTYIQVLEKMPELELCQGWGQLQCLLWVYRPLSFTEDTSAGLFPGCKDVTAALCSAESDVLRATLWSSGFSHITRTLRYRLGACQRS